MHDDIDAEEICSADNPQAEWGPAPLASPAGRARRESGLMVWIVTFTLFVLRFGQRVLTSEYPAFAVQVRL